MKQNSSIINTTEYNKALDLNHPGLYCLYMSCKPKTFVSCHDTIISRHETVISWHDTTISRHATYLYITILTSLFRLLCPTIALSPEEQVRDTLEVLLHYYTQALSIETVAREVAVICLVVDINGKITIGEE